MYLVNWYDEETKMLHRLEKNTVKILLRAIKKPCKQIARLRKKSNNNLFFIGQIPTQPQSTQTPTN
jgi:hypothetical protein